MDIAIPTDNNQTIYHDNAYTAPKFTIYSIFLADKTNIRFSLKSVIDNPLSSLKCDSFDPKQLECGCDAQNAANLGHIYEHYALLDAISGCSYLLANKYCENVSRTMKKGNIAIYKIPPIIKEVEMAIKNFLIGASLANRIQHIHHAS
jgi:predicted Fe-Mo cluster-binding NifX family protein